jgi:hypothetical protein
MKQAQPTFQKLPQRDMRTSDLDPAKLSTTLRELTLRAHQLARAVDASGPSGADLKYEDLMKVHAQILGLQRSLGLHHLDDLAIYVSALRARVEEYLV